MNWLGPLQCDRLPGNQLANSFCLPIFLSGFNCSIGRKRQSLHLLPWILRFNLKSQSLACFFFSCFNSPAKGIQLLFHIFFISFLSSCIFQSSPVPFYFPSFIKKYGNKTKCIKDLANAGKVQEIQLHPIHIILTHYCTYSAGLVFHHDPQIFVFRICFNF